MNTAEEDTRVFVGSDNVFSDLGLPDAEEHLTKAALVSRIGEIIKNRHLTQQKAAEILGIDQPKISKLLRGHFQDFSTDRLFRLLNSLDRDIEIIIRKKPSSRTKAQVRVVAA